MTFDVGVVAFAAHASVFVIRAFVVGSLEMALNLGLVGLAPYLALLLRH